jgi:hypothetical protein
MAHSTWRLWEAAPAGALPAEPGPWRHEHGKPLHGVWARPLDRGTELVVAANQGYALRRWVVPSRRWHVVSPLCSVANAVLGAAPWVWAAPDTLLASDPQDTALAFVGARRRPLARLQTADADRAQAWAATARAAELVVRERDAGGLQVVEAAVNGTVGDLFDLPGLLGDLAGCGLDADRARLAGEALAELGERHLVDLFAAEGPAWAWGVGPLVAQGIAQGRHPALIAGALLGLAAPAADGDLETEALLLTLGAAARRAPLPDLPHPSKTRHLGETRSPARKSEGASFRWQGGSG